MNNNYNIMFESKGSRSVDFGYRLEETIFDKNGNKTTWVSVLIFEDEDLNESVYLPVLLRQARGLLGFIPLLDWHNNDFSLLKEKIYYFAKNSDERNESRDKLWGLLHSSTSNSKYKIYCENEDIICDDVFCFGVPREDRFIKFSRELDIGKISNFSKVADKALCLIKQKVYVFKL
ncbi:hypothetical protein [Pseudoalteromonas shioyasakiensis]|uniref:hypothetical protein n=1 Tax=Pseudoalteromonas shioyasakiensis TaxID=1190813 RepID=UPI002551D02C|nr:hypothetical protein [Pseudoalteromonas shioyasakiensis]MDK9683651.1 hypothetical protein [Pseudoalteromonas shioyasakiensis]